MSNNSLVEREITQGVLPIGTPKAYKYDAALVEAAKATVRQGIIEISEHAQLYVNEARDYAEAAAEIVGVGVDPTLSIANAAGEAQAAGSRLTNIENAMGIVPLSWESGGITINGGTDYASTTNYRTRNRIPTTAGETFYIFGIPSDCDFYIHEYKSDSSVAYVEVDGSYYSKYAYTTRENVVEIRFRANRSTDPKGVAESISVLQVNRNMEGVLLGYRYSLLDPIDLNDIRNGGIYYKAYSNNDVDNMPSGLETNSSGLLVVYALPTVSPSICQIYYPNQGEAIYIRAYSGSSWGDWTKYETGLSFQKTLGDGDNIDNLTVAGIWQINAATVSLIDGTFPADWLKTNATLFNINSNTAVVQFLCDGDASNVPNLFVRRKTAAGSWSAWYTVKQKSLEYKKTLGDGDNIDNLTGIGIWQIDAATVNLIDGTFPADWLKTNATLFNINSNTAVAQFLCSGDGSEYPSLFVRRKTNASWSEWRRVTRVARGLPVNTDVNTLIREGTYTFTGVNAVTFSGMPQSNLRNAGVLKVFSIYPAGWSTSSAGRIAQLIINSAGKMYFRYRNDPYDAEDSSVGWGAWQEVGNDFSFYDCRERSIVGNYPAKSGLPIVYIDGDLTGISHDDAVNITWSFKGESGEGTLKWQGRGSLGFPKKNYTIKLSAKHDFGWGDQKKYVLKGCYNDPSFSTNLTGAKLWGEMSKTRNNVPTQLLPETAPNYGAVDGYPVMVVINNAYAGLYDFNIPKDKWMVGMGNGDAECLICSDQISEATEWREMIYDIAEDGTDWVLEEKSDEVTTSDIITSLNRAIYAVMNAGSDWETTVGQYVDIDSAIDYFILRCIIDDRDGAKNNQLLVTYDMVKWHFLPYDMDNSFGLTNQYYDTFPINKVGDNRFAVYAQSNALFNLIWTYSKAKLKARYQALRANVLSYRKVYYTAIDIMGRIPAVALAEEHSMYPVARANSVFDVSHMINHYRINCEVCDEALDYGGTP